MSRRIRIGQFKSGEDLVTSKSGEDLVTSNPAKIFDFRSTRVHGEVDQTSSFTPQSLQGFGWRRFGLVSCAHLVLHHRTPKRPQVVLDTATSSSHHLGYRIFDKLVASISLIRGGKPHDRELAHMIFQRLVAHVLATRGKSLTAGRIQSSVSVN